MKLQHPFKIGPRLRPALQIDDGWLSLQASGRDAESRVVYHWAIDIPAGSFESEDLRGGCGNKVDYRKMFGTLLSFLGAAVESLRHRTQNRIPLDDRDRDDNLHLFPLPVVEWAAGHADEIAMLGCEIEETPGLITED